MGNLLTAQEYTQQTINDDPNSKDKIYGFTNFDVSLSLLFVLDAKNI
jgi:hypothetical protein